MRPPSLHWCDLLVNICMLTRSPIRYRLVRFVLFGFTAIGIFVSAAVLVSCVEGRHTVDSAALSQAAAAAPTCEEVADRFLARLDQIDRLTVVSEQQVSYLTRPLSKDDPSPSKDAYSAITTANRDVATVSLRITASMTRQGYDVKMWRSDIQQPVTELTLAPVDGFPTVTERQWYPVLNQYRTATYPSPSDSGIGDYAHQSCMFDALRTRVCATAEFLNNWLGGRQSFQPDAFHIMMGKATLAGMENIGEHSCYRLFEPVYEDSLEDKYLSRKNTFWVDSDSQMLVRWRIEYVSIRYGESASYQLIDATYEYPDLATRQIKPAQAMPGAVADRALMSAVSIRP